MKKQEIIQDAYGHKIRVTFFEPSALPIWITNNFALSNIYTSITDQLAECKLSGEFDETECNDINQPIRFWGIWKIISSSDEKEFFSIESVRFYAEVVADIAYEAGALNFNPTGDSRATTNTIISWANEFTRKHQNTDWHTVDYIDMIYEFVDKSLNHGQEEIEYI